MNLLEAQVGQSYVISKIATQDPQMDAFLLSLGAYAGEQIALISKKKRSCIVAIKGERYSLDHLLSQTILLQ